MKGMQYFISCELYLTFLHISGASHETKCNNISWDISQKCLDFTEFFIPSLASRLSEFRKRICLLVKVKETTVATFRHRKLTSEKNLVWNLSLLVTSLSNLIVLVKGE